MRYLLVECAVRAALIALGTAAVLCALRVKSAGARHAASTAVVALMLLLPSWMAWGPRASLRILPPAPAPAILLAPPLSPDEISSADRAAGLAVPLAAASGAPPGRRPVPWNWPAAVYFSGVFILLARLALGTLRAHALVRRATRSGGRLTSPMCAAPITVGWLRPTVILPQCWRSWPLAQLDAVLTHEGEHVRRRDPLVQWLALLNRAIFWFHPLAWWLEYRLAALAEEACDAAVLERGHDPHDYSGYLLELARSVGRMGARIDVVGMAMPGSSLPQRIQQILARGPVPRVTRGRAVCVAVACAVLSAVFAGASVDRQWAPVPPVPPAPPVQVVPPAPPTLPAPATAPAPRAEPAPAAAPAPPTPPATSPVYELAPVPPPPPPTTSFRPASPAPIPPAIPQPPQPPPQKYDGKRLIVLYFDLYGTSEAIAAGTDYIQTQIQPTDLIAIMTGSDEVRVVEDFTGDHDKAIGEIQKLTFHNSETTDVDRALDRLLSATKILASLPEKKMLVYFMPHAVRQSAGPRQLQPLIESAQRASVAFYPIDTMSAAYKLEIGDTISMLLWNESQIERRLTVGPDGTVAIPSVGSVRAAGLTAAQLQSEVETRLLANVKTPQVTIRIVYIHVGNPVR